MRKVCVVTGTRAEYGLLKPIMKKIQEDDSLSLQIVATGTHLLPDYGLTIERIIEDGFNVDARVPIVLSGDSKEVLPHSIGHGIIGFSQAFEMLDPEIVLVLGDRYEILAAAIAASYGGRVLAHIAGGDKTSGGYDEYTRHAITKISHIHFASSKKSAERIIKLGEYPENVFIVGSPSIETIRSREFSTKKELCHKLNLNENIPIILFVLHPISTKPETAAEEVRLLLEVVLKYKHQIVLIYPNVDPGSKKIIEVIERYRAGYPNKIKIFKNLPHLDYLNLMKFSDLMVGNSSSGIVESSAFKLPVVNIGHRQKGRESAGNVINIDYSTEAIYTAINTCLYDQEFIENLQWCINPYDHGKTSDIICNVLKTLNINVELFSKSIFYD